VKGVRVGVANNPLLATPQLQSGVSGDPFVCRVVNTGSSQAVTITLFGTSGASASQFFSVGSMQSVAVTLATSEAFCTVQNNGFNSSNLRTSLYVRGASSGNSMGVVEAQ